MTGRVRQAVIMVGGKGTRLRPLTNKCPKPVLPILDKPCTEYFLDSLAEAGIEEIIMACGYRSQQVVEALGDGSKQGVRVVYSYEDSPMGTGGAVKILEDRLDDVFIAINGDNFMDIDFKEMVRRHFDTGSCVTMSLSRTDNPTEVGIVRLDGTGRVLEFKEKPRPEEVFSDILNTGVYVINREVLKFVPDGSMYDLSKELFPLLLQRNLRIQGYEDPGQWMDIGRPKDYLRANLLTAGKRYLGHDWSSRSEDSRIVGTCYIGEGTSVISSELDDAVVSKGSKILNSSLKRSLVLPGCVLEGCVLEDTILGRDCRIGKGCVLRGCVMADGTELENAVLQNEGGI